MDTWINVSVPVKDHLIPQSLFETCHAETRFKSASCRFELLANYLSAIRHWKTESQSKFVISCD